MRLRELVRGRGERGPLPGRVREELAALDAALAGEPVAPAHEGLARLAAELQAERPAPDPAFAARLDRWAGEGFAPPADPRPRAGARDSGRATRGPRQRLRRRVAGGPWLPVAATTFFALLVAGSALVVAPRLDDQGEPGGGEATLAAPARDGETGGASEAAPAPAGGELPSLRGGARDAGAAETRRQAGDVVGGASGAARVAPALPLPRDEGHAAGVELRRVERDAQLELAAPADEVQDVANEAIAVVDRHEGLVLSSRVGASDGEAQAVLALQIPGRNLDAALAELKRLADVRSFSEGAADITAPFLDARERLAELRAERRGVLRQIEAATTTEELDELKRRLRRVDARIERAKRRFDGMQHRARQAQVSLVVTSQGAREGEWSLGEALDDAARVLTVAAGVTLVAGAVLLPLALFAALALLLIRAWRGRSRERALDESG